MSSTRGVKMIMVMMESMAGTGHIRTLIRPKGGDPVQQLNFDPIVQSWVLYNEKKKIRSLKKR